MDKLQAAIAIVLPIVVAILSVNWIVQSGPDRALLQQIEQMKAAQGHGRIIPDAIETQSRQRMYSEIQRGVWRVDFDGQM